jgi:hypothetical protein
MQKKILKKELKDEGWNVEVPLFRFSNGNMVLAKDEDLKKEELPVKWVNEEFQSIGNQFSYHVIYQSEKHGLKIVAGGVLNQPLYGVISKDGRSIVPTLYSCKPVIQADCICFPHYKTKYNHEGDIITRNED